MCDQTETQNFNFDPSQFCGPFEYSASDQCDAQYQNAESCTNCEDPKFCRPEECNQCFVPPPPPFPQNQSRQPSENSFAQCESYPQMQTRPSYQQCPSPCYQQQACDTDCEPCVQRCDPCEPCVQRCDPCEPLGPCPMPSNDGCQPCGPCPPLDTCSPMCSPYRRRRYVQPPRRESCKPIITYQRPCVPMTSDTVYKQSFDCIDAQTAASCRMPPVYPSGQLKTPCGDFARDTVMKLSFAAPFCPGRTRPIYPHSPSLLGQGPMQALTTQKHDFVPKFQFKRLQCTPRDNIKQACGCIEESTTQRLSFMRPDTCNFSKALSCKPIISYKPPELPMEFETTQKLSYMPVCPAPKDDMPWARKAKYCPPSIKFARDTVAKLSFQPPGCFLPDCNDYCCEDKCNLPRASC